MTSLLLASVCTVEVDAQGPIVFPRETNPTLQGLPVQEFARRWRAGRRRQVKHGKRVLDVARTWAQKPDTYWLQRVSPTAPLGMWSVACPIHPFHVRDFATKFDWSIHNPWQLVCPLCKKEGRQYAYYPNPDFPDDGSGCRPNDEVWRKVHDEAWSRRNRGIPWDRWDGMVHGYSESHAYFFRGKCAHLCMYHVARHTLRQLTQAYLVGRFCFAEGSVERQLGDRAARSAKVILLTYARAFLGDPYLVAVTGKAEDEHRAWLEAFYEASPDELGWFEGYVPYAITGDRLYTDTGFRRKGGASDMFGNGSQYGRANAYGWSRAFAEIRSSFSDEEERTVLPCIARLLSAQPGDAKRLAQHPKRPRIRYGILDYMPSPYRMWMNHNLCGAPFSTQFELGRLLNDRKIIDALTRNVAYYLHDFFWGDGLSWEGSPHYSNVGLNNLDRFVGKFAGYRGHYDASHPMWDPKLGGLTPYRHPAYASMAWKQALTTLPNGRKIAWEDAVAHAVPHLDAVQRALEAGRKMPDRYADWYIRPKDKGKANVKGVRTDALPSWVFHHNRKVLLRAGSGPAQAVASLNYGWRVGHWHYASQDLVLFAEGHEMLNDLGYLGAMATLTKAWIRHPEAHQMVVVRDKRGSSAPSLAQRGELIGFASDEVLGYAETCELARARLAILGRRGHYGRAIFLVPLPGGGQYVFDLARVRGGAWHEWYAHFGQEDVSLDGVSLAPTGSDLAEALAIESKASRTPTSWVREVTAGTTSDPVIVRALGCVAWDAEGKRHVDGKAGIQTVVLGAPDTDVLVGQAPGQRNLRGHDVHARLRVVCLRRKAASHLDFFAAVHEPFRDSPKVLNVSRASIEPNREGSFAVVVRHRAGTDWVLCGPSTLDDVEPSGVPSQVARVGGLTVEWSGQAAFVRFDSDGAPRVARLFGPGFVRAGRLAIHGLAAWRAQLIEFDDERDTLDVTASATSADLHRAAPILYVRHEHGTSTYSLRRIEHAGDRRCRIQLDHTPHLAINRLEVNRVHRGDIVVEPPPNLPRSAGPLDPLHLGLEVYARRDGRHQWLGTVAGRGGLVRFDAFGQRFRTPESTLKLSPGPPNVASGEGLEVTRLRLGRDHVIVPTWVGSRWDREPEAEAEVGETRRCSMRP